jgi:hypothetical protein
VHGFWTKIGKNDGLGLPDALKPAWTKIAQNGQKSRLGFLMPCSFCTKIWTKISPRAQGASPFFF